MRGRLAAPVAALGLTLVLGACGSGGGKDTSSAPVPAVVKAEEARPRVAPLKVSGGGSAQFHVNGADNSIQEYGEEASRGELRRAARVVHDYLAALATEDWKSACSYLSRKELDSLERVVATSLKIKGCRPALAKLIGSVTAAEGREATVVDAASLRREGDQGFLIYRGAQGRPYFVSLRREGGEWALAGLSPAALS